MSDIQPGAGARPDVSVPAETLSPRLISQRVGEATLYFRVDRDSLPVANAAEVRAVAAINTNVFDQAARVVGEGIKAMSERIGVFANTVRPTELNVEISFSFEVTGKATIVPVLLTGESKSSAGLKVTAIWKPATGE